MTMGREGYLDSCKQIVGAARRIEEGIRNIEGLTILGEPKSSVVAFQSDSIEIYAVGDKMSERGWHRELSLSLHSAILFLFKSRLTHH